MVFPMKLVSASFFCLLTGCISLDGKMVNAAGEVADCSASGGGFGLGMVVGAAAAAASNQLCESSYEDKGYILHDSVGHTGIDLPKEDEAPPVVLAANEPAAPCIKTGDRLIEVDGSPVTNAISAKRAIFKESGEPVSILAENQEDEVTCSFELK